MNITFQRSLDEHMVKFDRVIEEIRAIYADPAITNPECKELNSAYEKLREVKDGVFKVKQAHSDALMVIDENLDAAKTAFVKL